MYAQGTNNPKMLDVDVSVKTECTNSEHGSNNPKTLDVDVSVKTECTNSEHGTENVRRGCQW